MTTIGGSLVTVPLPNNGTVTRPSDQRAPQHSDPMSSWGDAQNVILKFGIYVPKCSSDLAGRIATEYLSHFENQLFYPGFIDQAEFYFKIVF